MFTAGDAEFTYEYDGNTYNETPKAADALS